MNNQTKRNFNIFRANNTFNSSPKNIDYEFKYDKNKEIIIKLKEQIKKIHQKIIIKMITELNIIMKIMIKLILLEIIQNNYQRIK